MEAYSNGQMVVKSEAIKLVLQYLPTPKLIKIQELNHDFYDRIVPEFLEKNPEFP